MARCDSSASDPSVGDSSDALFLPALEKWLQNKGGMKKIAADLGLSLEQFRNKIRDAYRQDFIVLRPPEDKDEANRLHEKWPHVKYRVLKAPGAYFHKNAACVFLSELNELLLAGKRNRKNPLRIGVVSGITSGGVIEAICNVEKADWKSHLDVKLLPPKIHIFALNVSQTDGYDQLKGNATVLAYQLARKFQAVTQENTEVEAYGLSAAMLQSEQERQKTDCSRTTGKLVAQTDPRRLAASLHALGKEVPKDLPKESQLDVVITGVGCVEDSLFRSYCEADEFDFEQLQHIAGDIAYHPVTAKGELKDLCTKAGEKYEFYCAVSLDVLRKMSADSSKRVIVVALSSPGSSKTDIVHAAIYGDKPLCNVLITDDIAASELYHEFKK